MADQCIVCLENLDSAVPLPQLQRQLGVEDDHGGGGPAAVPGGGGGAAPAPPAAKSSTTTADVSLPDLPAAVAGATLTLSANGKDKTPETADLNTKTGEADGQDDNIAIIQVCGHILHDSCLKAWTVKANSCPICRQTFHNVQVYDQIGGTLLSSYEVEDKKQVAEFDPLAWLDENAEEEEEQVTPCPVCNTAENEEVLLLCDGCDTPYHTHCIGLEDVPDGSWFCMECAHQLGQAIEDSLPALNRPPGRRNRRGFFPRTRGSMRNERNRGRTDGWLGAWGEVSGHILGGSGIDVDFHEADDDLAEYRRSQQLRDRERREWQRWQQRLSIASRLGARDVFARNIQGVVEQQVAPQPPPVPPREETREERLAWSAMERARDATPNSRKRKSRSTTASPQEPAPEPERRLKRPRTRRNPLQTEAGPSRAASASSNATSNNHREANGGHTEARSPPATDGQPTFLSSLLREVEMTTPNDDDTIRGLFGVPPPQSVDPSSPVSSPSASARNSPRALSLTPPPQPPNGAFRSASRSPVLSLSSHIEPLYPPANYSPTRSNGESSDSESRPNTNGHRNGSPELRQPRPRRQHEIRLPRAEDASPTRLPLPLEVKESISKVVRNALKPHWSADRSKRTISSDQYATINRKVSHRIYEEVSDPSAVDDEAKQAWEKIANKEVARAVAELKT
ncbi:hypothetical protein KVR01_004834 [Diaporthe batatas]|uniref:uncharacterized protein n=1 Tax=Diaporthe batatas TaxID=748121 RepID=UPI001D042261|nr:uncharacterized protein KVR01_004834 [Diaporthe batatas]KAG8166282.1 hypothetical protein KVR01_004834 [Diaporthe batatas]